MTTHAGESGMAVTELLLVTPLLVVLLLFVAFGGRLLQARGDVDSAARDAARAATLTRSPAEAQAAAHRAATTALGGGTAPCAPLTVDVDTDGFRPGGQVTVTVVCHLHLADLALLGIPGTSTLIGRATSVIDTYRGIDQ
jgi:Flp pilus assembly protein TadG